MGLPSPNKKGHRSRGSPSVIVPATRGMTLIIEYS